MDNLLLNSQLAKELYFATKDLPIIDYHYHLSVSDISENKRYFDIYELWIEPDPCRSEGRTGTYNQWVIDNLMEYDVPVIDMYDKIYKGTFLGGNLTTALKNKTKNENGGAVIWGGVRDTEQMKNE